MLALIEYMHLQKENDLVFVPIKVIEMLGDSSSLTKKNYQKGESNSIWYIRNTVKRDLCMITAQFVCVQCNLFVEDNKTLELHVKEHREFECTDCKIKFEKYKDLVSHRLTFCRSPLNSKTCLECNINKDSCQYQNNMQQTITICKEWTTTVKRCWTTIHCQDY